ncbi:MAG TPA: nuclear transport factor 2 family protein [Propionibacteriaceae bacterium]|nr:nuclear transport factor 2 family protein [Propionibacteriaceae bacterium]
MAEAQSVQNLRKGYKAFAEADMEALAEVIPEDAVWHIPGNSTLAGDYKGRDAVFGYFGKLTEVTGGTFKAELVYVLGDDKFAIALQRSTAAVKGQTYSGTDVLVDRIENDAAVETWVYLEDQARFDALLS